VSFDRFDWEPEDSFDAGDRAEDMARNLVMRLDALDASRGIRPIDDLIASIEQRASAYQRIREQLDERQQLRLDQLREDLPTLRERSRHE
jgi:uncharacterized protein with von Willebrand factor type A (vWA) domain